MFINKLKLQMFADDVEELEDGDLPATSDDDIIENENDEDDIEEVEGEDDFLEEDDNLDKKTKALIRYKQEAKEAKKKLEELNEQLEGERLKDQESKRVDELKKTGVSEDIAKNTAKAEMQSKLYEAKLANYEYSDLKEIYPNITNHRKEIEELISKYPGMTREELYLAKFSKNANFEVRRNLEAELAYKKKISKDKSFVDGVVKDKANVKLTRSETIAFKEVKKFSPNMTKEQFYKSLNEEEEMDF